MLTSNFYGAALATSERHLPYDTEIEIFEKKCGNCPFVYMKVTEMLNRASGEMSQEYRFYDVESLNAFLYRFSFDKNLLVERGCGYGTNLIGPLENRPKYWLVDEIVINGCELWKTPVAPNEKLDDDFWSWYYDGAKIMPGKYRASFETLRLLYDGTLIPLPTEDLCQMNQSQL